MPSSRSKAFTALVIVLFVIGFLVRLLPLFDHGGRLLQQYPTEDGYLMLTIARNLAIGKGFSVADGTIPTNGTQPLITFLWALGLKLTGGDRSGGVLFALVVQLIGAGAGAYMIYRLGLKVFHTRMSRELIALLAASVWYASPVIIPHSMNCLETGFYAPAACAVAYVFVEKEGARDVVWSVRKCLLVGLLLGGVFWLRNDSVFLILAACLVYLFNDLSNVWARFKRTLIFGATSVVVALPWLGFNYTSFGHIMPVSGRAESLTGSFASNLYFLPPVLTEYVILALPIPEQIQITGPAVAATSFFLLLMLPLASLLWARAKPTERSLFVIVTIFGLGLIIFYGLFFGAFWFLSRYLFPLSGLLSLAWAAVALRVHHRVKTKSRALAMAAPLLLLPLMMFVHVRGYRKGNQHMHFQVVRWVEANVPKDVWVGAIQTGTVGYFHDRTINLDGKVNIHAYEALVGGRIADYVVDDTEIRYLADWAGMLDWRSMQRIDDNFEVLVADRERNLGVLVRATTSTVTSP